MKEKDTIIFNSITWIILVGILSSGLLIARYEEYNSFFISLLTVEIILVIFMSRRFTNAQITAGRIILGLVFICSGFVKGVDPVGTEYRIVDYFIAFGTEWASPIALPLSVLLNSVEFVLGILLLFNVAMRYTSWLVMLMMAVFTVVTINDAMYNPVPDCGCFGDALVISNWQTFYKNLIIDALLLIVFLSRNRVSKWIAPKIGWAILFVSVFGFIVFEIYNIRHLPVIDFRDWKVGNKMVNGNPLPLKYYLTYKHSKTGEEKEYLSPDYPYNDSVWLSQWEFFGQRIVDPNPVLHDLRIEDEDGNDFTDQIIANPDFQFILVAYDLSKSSSKNMDKIREISEGINEPGLSFVVITSSLPKEVQQFKESNLPDADFYFADDITMMSMIRSKPGLILLKDGVIQRKWHYNDFPSINVIKQDLLIP
ncbi:MAG: DoxX family protein [Bacteroidales bacterium]|nr:DoxX family protein [Bacteroidales bacterium]